MHNLTDAEITFNEQELLAAGLTLLSNIKYLITLELNSGDTDRVMKICDELIRVLPFDKLDELNHNLQLLYQREEKGTG